MTIDGIVGPRGRGKTTAVQALIAHASLAGRQVSGIVAPVVYDDGVRVGYDIVDVRTGRRAPWLRIAERPGAVGPFSTVHAGEVLARTALDAMLRYVADLAVIDELGEWELEGAGHRWAVDRLTDCPARWVVIVMRDTVVERVKTLWGFPHRSWDPSQVAALAATLGIGDRSCP